MNRQVDSEAAPTTRQPFDAASEAAPTTGQPFDIAAEAEERLWRTELKRLSTFDAAAADFDNVVDERKNPVTRW